MSLLKYLSPYDSANMLKCLNFSTFLDMTFFDKSLGKMSDQTFRMVEGRDVVRHFYTSANREEKCLKHPYFNANFILNSNMW